MYYPKSQVTTNQYTNGGEFVIQSSNTPYTGYYYVTSKGEYYTGKTPNESPSYNLKKFNNSKPTNKISTPEDEFIPTQDYYIINDDYYNAKSLSSTRIPPENPKQTYPAPQTKDYNIGEFQRYFLKKSNESKFIEISQLDYEKYLNQSNGVQYELYIPTQISWVLTGDKNQVYQVNKTTVERTEREQSLYGFTQYFKDKFTQFYK